MRYWPRIRAAPQVFEPPAWAQRASCRGSDLDFYVDASKVANRPAVDAAKAVCSNCPVREDCLQYALRNGETFGIWGGRTEKERSTIRRRRAQPGRREAA
jgi:WhiB family transcriptional regulator, redox-sensing transcriptional regulator